MYASESIIASRIIMAAVQAILVKIYKNWNELLFEDLNTVLVEHLVYVCSPK